MTQKKFFQIAGIIVLSIWIFCGTFAIAIANKRSKNPVQQQNPTIVTASPITTAPIHNQGANIPTSKPPATTMPQATTAPQVTLTPGYSSSDPTQSPAQPEQTTGAPTSQSSVPQGKEAIVSAYVNGVNNLKATPDFTMSKTDTLNVNITDVQMSMEMLKNQVMDFANSLIKPPEPEYYTFRSGVDSATGETPNSTVAPLNVPAAVDINAVTDAQAYQNADGGYTVTLTLQPETQTLASPAPNLSTMVQVIDVSSLLPSGATLTDVNISYAPSTITATFDSSNRIVSMEHKLVSQGSGSGKMVVAVTMQMEGNYTSNYAISYN